MTGMPRLHPKDDLDLGPLACVARAETLTSRAIEGEPMSAEEQGESAGTTAGVVAGLLSGAELGSKFIPLPFVGPVVGGVVGAAVGSEIGKRLGRALFAGGNAFVKTLTS
jgi:phage tail tape-measure protein